MLAIKSDLKTVDKFKKEVEKHGNNDWWLDYSCFNSPSQIVVGGQDDAVDAMAQMCKNNGIKSTIINSQLALHTRALKCVEQPFQEALQVSALQICLK